MGEYFGTAREAIERHGGTVEKFIGDAARKHFHDSCQLALTERRVDATRRDLRPPGLASEDNRIQR